MRKMSVLAALCLAAMGRATIVVDNMDAGETVRYPLVVLKGHVDEESIRVGLSDRNMNRFPAFRHRFAAVCELKPGTNFVILAAGGERTRMRIDYRPMTTPYKALAVWLVASDETPDTVPQGAAPHGDIRAKMDVALKLMQSFTAEAMHEAGYERKTFPLELDASGKVIVHIVRSPKTGHDLRSMDANESWQAIYDQLSKELPGDTNHWLTLLGFTGWDVRTRKATGHMALGGGQLAAFGAGSVAYWPGSVGEIAKAFVDRRRVDPAETFDDSNSRSTAWANASTGIGAWLHEAGHTFGLPHSPDALSIMSRGFDYFSREFSSYEAPSAKEPNERQVLQNMVPKWDAFFAARLDLNPFFQPDGNAGRPYPANDVPSIVIDKTGDSIVVTAQAALKIVGAERDDTPAVYREIKDGSTSLRIRRSEYMAKMGNRPYRIVVIDAMGRQTVVDDSP